MPGVGVSSPQMVLDVGGKWVILGHSERRHIFNEDSEVRVRSEMSV